MTKSLVLAVTFNPISAIIYIDQIGSNAKSIQKNNNRMSIHAFDFNI